MAKILEPAVDLTSRAVARQDKLNIDQLSDQTVNSLIAMIDDCSDDTYSIKSD